MRTRKIIAAAAATLTAVAGIGWLSGGAALHADAAAAGLFKIDCGFSHSAPDDPILYPGQPGAAHLHDFFGNTSTNADSTYDSLNGVTSTCANNDRAAYWVPALYQNGKKIDPTGAITYYTTSAGPPADQVAFPPDMRIIVGDAKATSPEQQPGQIEWGCSDNTQIGAGIPAHCGSGHIQVRIRFPSCWDGVSVPGNAIEHLRYPSRGTCPDGFGTALPALRFNAGYQVGPDTGEITLASGSVYSIHADFLNSWDQRTLEGLVAECFHREQDCGHRTGTSPGR